MTDWLVGVMDEGSRADGRGVADLYVWTGRGHIMVYSSVIDEIRLSSS